MECQNYSNNKDSLKKSVKQLDIRGQELIYGLVSIYNNKNDNPEVGIPYGGRRMKDGHLRFDLNNLPEELVRILNNFCEKHLTKMEEDKARDEFTNS